VKTWAALTPAGRQAFGAHLDALRRLIEQSEAG
jgi:hypothetical protein